MKNLKKTFTSIACLLLVAACSATGYGCNSSDELTYTWRNYNEKDSAFVYDYYTYSMPEVFDSLGREYDVDAKVTDKDGNLVDSFGGLFLINKAEDYTITYSVDVGNGVQKKTMTVKGVKRAEYTLADTKLAYGLNETVDLNGKIISTMEGEVNYTVKQGETDVALENNMFVPTQTGMYSVTATMPNQPKYTFDIAVVDKATTPYPNGMIWDNAANNDVNCPIQGTSEGKPLTASVAKTLDAEDTFDADSNGATKMSVDFPNTSCQFDMPITVKPQYSKAYYQALKDGGYPYIAVRMKIENDAVSPLENYGVLFNQNATATVYRTVTQAGEVGSEKTDSAFWGELTWQSHPLGWFEALFSIDSFLTQYSEEGIPLFCLRTFDGYYGKINLWVDNVYAVKPVQAEPSAFIQKDLNEEYLMSELSIGDETDVDVAINTVSVNGESVTVTNGKCTLTEEGVYSVSRRARNRYGVAQTRLITMQTTATDMKLVEFTSTENFVSTHAYQEDSTTPLVELATSYDATVGALKVDYVHPDGAPNTYYDIAFQMERTKEYLEYFQYLSNDYPYVTMRLGLPTMQNTFKISACVYQHRNEISAANSKVWLNSGGKLTAVSALTYPGTDPAIRWIDISVSLSDFVTNCNGRVGNIVRLFSVGGASYTVYVKGVYLTTNGVYPEAQA